MKRRSITPRMEDLNHRGTPVPAAVLTGITMVILVLTSAACIFPNPERKPALATPQTDPVTLTPEVRRYADCALGNAHGAYGPDNVVGFNAQGQTLPQLQQARCRLLEPKDTRVTTPGEFQSCQQEQNEWVTREYGENGEIRGSLRKRAWVYVQTLCAPSPPVREAP